MRARRFEKAVLGGLLPALLIVSGCGGNGELVDRVPPGIDLPEVGTLGRAPRGEAAIVVDVTAEGEITIDGGEPLSLRALAEEFERRTSEEWENVDGTTRKILLVNADRDLPWTVALWIMMCAAQPNAEFRRMFFGARAVSDGAVGAICWTFPHGRFLQWRDPPPRVRVKVQMHDGPQSDPEAIVQAIVDAAGDGPVSDVIVDIKSHWKSGCAAPTGFVIRVLDAALRAGVQRINFEGAAPPRGEALDSVEGLLQHVAKIRKMEGEPSLRLGGEILPDRAPPHGAAVPKGRLARLYGEGVERDEALPVYAFEDIEEEPETFPEPPLDGPTPEEVPVLTGTGAFPDRGRPGGSGALPAALDWLAAHQSPDGRWSAANFGAWCHGEPASHGENLDGEGNAVHDVGVTGLALYAFLGAGYTHRGRHPYAKVVSKGLRFLKNVQDADGCFGSRAHGGWLYDHAMAAVAMVEAYGMTRSPIFRDSARNALWFTVGARKPSGVWHLPAALSESDPAINAWLVLLFRTAELVNEREVEGGRSASLPFDATVCVDLRAWFETAADSRASTLARLLLLEDPHKDERCRAAIDAIAAHPPAWTADNGSVDPVSWHFAALALFHWGDDTVWSPWLKAMRTGIESHQRTDTDVCRYKGSWDPLPVPAFDGGRVATTALMVLCLETAMRYPRGFVVR